MQKSGWLIGRSEEEWSFGKLIACILMASAVLVADAIIGLSATYPDYRWGSELTDFAEQWHDPHAGRYKTVDPS